MRVESVRIGPGAVEAILRFVPGEPLRSSEVPGLVDELLRRLPGLKGHRCHNSIGFSFLDEARDTELAHLVEHASLELMAMAGSPETLRGATSWDFAVDGRGVFHVDLGYDDDVVAIGALRVASELVGALAVGDEPPDVVAEAVRLRGLRSR